MNTIIWFRKESVTSKEKRRSSSSSAESISSTCRLVALLITAPHSYSRIDRLKLCKKKFSKRINEVVTLERWSEVREREEVVEGSELRAGMLHLFLSVFISVSISIHRRGGGGGGFRLGGGGARIFISGAILVPRRPRAEARRAGHDVQQPSDVSHCPRLIVFLCKCKCKSNHRIPSVTGILKITKRKYTNNGVVSYPRFFTVLCFWVFVLIKYQILKI